MLLCRRLIVSSLVAEDDGSHGYRQQAGEPPSRAGRVTLEESNDVVGQKLWLLEGGEVPAAIEARVPNHIVAVAVLLILPRVTMMTLVRNIRPLDV